jgi:hypothetical protein
MLEIANLRKGKKKNSILSPTGERRDLQKLLQLHLLQAPG